MGPDTKTVPPITTGKLWCDGQSQVSVKSGSTTISRGNIVFKEGLRLEARDLIDNKWWTAKVLEVDSTAGEVLLHFLGWNGRHDEWISMDSQRLRPALPKKTRRSQDGDQGGKVGGGGGGGGKNASSPAPFKEFKEGEEVMALWNKIKYPAKILRFEPDGTYLLEYYDGIKKKVVPKNIRKLNSDDTPFIKSCLEDLELLKEQFKNGGVENSAELGGGGRKRKAKFSVKEVMNIKTTTSSVSDSPSPSSSTSSKSGSTPSRGLSCSRTAGADKKSTDFNNHRSRSQVKTKTDSVTSQLRASSTRRRPTAGSKLTDNSQIDAKEPSADLTSEVTAVNGGHIGKERINCDITEDSGADHQSVSPLQKSGLIHETNSRHKNIKRPVQTVDSGLLEEHPSHTNLDPDLTSDTNFDLGVDTSSSTSITDGSEDSTPSEKENQPHSDSTSAATITSGGRNAATRSPGGVKRKADVQDLGIGQGNNTTSRRKRKRVSNDDDCGSRSKQSVAVVSTLVPLKSASNEGIPLTSIGGNRTAKFGSKKVNQTKRLKNSGDNVTVGKVVGSSSVKHGLVSAVSRDGVRGDPKLFPYLGFDFTKSQDEMKEALKEGVNYPGPALPVSLWSSKLPHGWKKMVYVRTKGLLNGKWEVYVESPEGAVFRTKMDLSRHFESRGLDLSIEDFDFMLDPTMKKIRNVWRQLAKSSSLNTDSLVTSSAGSQSTSSVISNGTSSSGTNSEVTQSTSSEGLSNASSEGSLSTPGQGITSTNDSSTVPLNSLDPCSTSASTSTSSTLTTSASATSSSSSSSSPSAISSDSLTSTNVTTTCTSISINSSTSSSPSSSLPGHQPGRSSRSASAALLAAAESAAMTVAAKKQSKSGTGVRCCLPDCNKLFRNGTLLLQHVKHYHSHLSGILEEFLGNSPTVTDMAYLRTRVGDSKQEFESDQYLLESIKRAKLKFDKIGRKKTSKPASVQRYKGRRGVRTGATPPNKPDTPSTDTSQTESEGKVMTDASNKSEDETGVLKLENTEDDTVTSAAGCEGALKSPGQRDSLSVTPASKSPLKGGVSSGLLTPATPLSAPVEPGSGSTYRRRKERSRRGSVREMLQAESTSPLSTPCPTECISLIDVSPLPSPSNKGEEEGVVTPPLVSSAASAGGSITPPTWKRRLNSSRHVTPEKCHEDKLNSSGGQPGPSNKLSRREPSVETMTEEELVQCRCGRVDGDGLMVQCEVCLSWQHGHCAAFFNEQQVPDCYICSTCLDPPWGRTSTKLVVPLFWSKEPGSLLPRLDSKKKEVAGSSTATLNKKTTSKSDRRAAANMKSEERLENLTSLMSELTRLAGLLHSLRVKLRVAEQANHPKVFMWSAPWESPTKMQDTVKEASEGPTVGAGVPGPRSAILSSGVSGGIPGPNSAASAGLEWSEASNLINQSLYEFHTSGDLANAPSQFGTHPASGGLPASSSGGHNGDHELDSQYLNLNLFAGGTKAFSETDQKPDGGFTDLLGSVDKSANTLTEIQSNSLIGKLIADCKMEDTKADIIKKEIEPVEEKDENLQKESAVIKSEKDLATLKSEQELAREELSEESANSVSETATLKSRTVTFSDAETNNGGAKSIRSSPLADGQPSKSILRIITDDKDNPSTLPDVNKVPVSHESKSPEKSRLDNKIVLIESDDALDKSCVLQGVIKGNLISSDSSDKKVREVNNSTMESSHNSHDKKLEKSNCNADYDTKDGLHENKNSVSEISAKSMTDSAGKSNSCDTQDSEEKSKIKSLPDHDTNKDKNENTTDSTENKNGTSEKKDDKEDHKFEDCINDDVVKSKEITNSVKEPIDTEDSSDKKSTLSTSERNGVVTEENNIEDNGTNRTVSRPHVRSSLDSETSVSTLEGSECVSADFQQSAATDFLFDFPSLNEVKQLLPGVLQDISQSMNLPHNSDASSSATNTGSPVNHSIITGSPVNSMLSESPANNMLTGSPAIIPEPKLIDREECRLNLMSHLEHMQDKVDSLLEELDREVSKFEAEVLKMADTSKKNTSSGPVLQTSSSSMQMADPSPQTPDSFLQTSHVNSVVEKLARDVRSAQRVCNVLCRPKLNN